MNNVHILFCLFSNMFWNKMVDWLVEWLIDWLVDWSINWRIDRRFHGQMDYWHVADRYWLIDWLNDLLMLQVYLTLSSQDFLRTNCPPLNCSFLSSLKRSVLCPTLSSSTSSSVNGNNHRLIVWAVHPHKPGPFQPPFAVQTALANPLRMRNAWQFLGIPV